MPAGDFNSQGISFMMSFDNKDAMKSLGQMRESVAQFNSQFNRTFEQQRQTVANFSGQVNSLKDSLKTINSPARGLGGTMSPATQSRGVFTAAPLPPLAPPQDRVVRQTPINSRPIGVQSASPINLSPSRPLVQAGLLNVSSGVSSPSSVRHTARELYELNRTSRHRNEEGDTLHASDYIHSAGRIAGGLAGAALGAKRGRYGAIAGYYLGEKLGDKAASGIDRLFGLNQQSALDQVAPNTRYNPYQTNRFGFTEQEQRGLDEARRAPTRGMREYDTRLIQIEKRKRENLEKIYDMASSKGMDMDNPEGVSFTRRTGLFGLFGKKQDLYISPGEVEYVRKLKAAREAPNHNAPHADKGGIFSSGSAVVGERGLPETVTALKGGGFKVTPMSPAQQTAVLSKAAENPGVGGGISGSINKLNQTVAKLSQTSETQGKQAAESVKRLDTLNDRLKQLTDKISAMAKPSSGTPGGMSMSDMLAAGGGGLGGAGMTMGAARMAARRGGGGHQAQSQGLLGRLWGGVKSVGSGLATAGGYVLGGAKDLAVGGLKYGAKQLAMRGLQYGAEGLLASPAAMGVAAAGLYGAYRMAGGSFDPGIGMSSDEIHQMLGTSPGGGMPPMPQGGGGLPGLMGYGQGGGTPAGAGGGGSQAPSQGGGPSLTQRAVGAVRGAAQKVRDVFSGGGQSAPQTGGAPSGAGSVRGLKQNDRSKFAMQFFMSKGYTKAAAAGIVGNLMEESGNFSDAVIYGKKKGDQNVKGGPAVGVAQWRQERITNFQKIYGRPLEGAPLEMQLDYVNRELNSKEYSKAKQALQGRGATDYQYATRAMDEFYEKSAGTYNGADHGRGGVIGGKFIQARLANARNIYGADTNTAAVAAATAAVDTAGGGGHSSGRRRGRRNNGDYIDLPNVPVSADSLADYKGKKFDPRILDYVKQVEGLGGLRLSGGHRTKERNRQVHGAEHSRHMSGFAADFVGTRAQMEAGLKLGRELGAGAGSQIHDAGSGTHLHLQWERLKKKDRDRIQQQMASTQGVGPEGLIGAAPPAFLDDEPQSKNKSNTDFIKEAADKVAANSTKVPSKGTDFFEEQRKKQEQNSTMVPTAKQAEVLNASKANTAPVPPKKKAARAKKAQQAAQSDVSAPEPLSLYNPIPGLEPSAPVQIPLAPKPEEQFQKAVQQPTAAPAQQPFFNPNSMLGGFGNGMIQGVGNILGGIGGFAQNTLGGIAGGIQAGYASGQNPLVGAFGGVLGGALGGIGGAVNSTMGLVGGAVNGVGNILGGVANGVGNVLGGLGGIAQNTFGGAANGIQAGIASGQGNPLVGAMGGILGGALGGINGLVGGATNFLGGLFGGGNQKQPAPTQAPVQMPSPPPGVGMPQQPGFGIGDAVRGFGEGVVQGAGNMVSGAMQNMAAGVRLSIPPIPMPGMPGIPMPGMPRIALPPIPMPGMPGIPMPPIPMPSINVGGMMGISMPGFQPHQVSQEFAGVMGNIKNAPMQMVQAGGQQALSSIQSIDTSKAAPDVAKMIEETKQAIAEMPEMIGAMGAPKPAGDLSKTINDVTATSNALTADAVRGETAPRPAPEAQSGGPQDFYREMNTHLKELVTSAKENSVVKAVDGMKSTLSNTLSGLRDDIGGPDVRRQLFNKRANSGM